MLGRPVVVLVLAVAAASFGCRSDTLTAPSLPRTLDVRVPLSWVDPGLALSTTGDSAGYTTVTMHLLECPGPGWWATSTAKLVGPEGGVLERGPFTLTIPAGALPDTQMVRLVRPAEDYLRFEASVGDFAHYQFAQPVSLTVNVAKYCPNVSADQLAQLLGVWMDAPGGAEAVPSIREVTNGKIRLTTDHFSSYGIAW